jgi:hypothetical protein
MRSSSRALIALVALCTLAAPAWAGPAAGFGVERLYPAAPGGGWFVLDDLALEGRLGGALGLTLGYERRPLRVRDDNARLLVISDRVAADVGAALTYDRWRFYFDLDLPIVMTGQSGTVAEQEFAAPSVNFSSHPDLIADVRLGIDVRLLGRVGGRFRLGGSAQLFVPFGDRADYVTDGTVRGMLRALCAGDVGHFTYAAQLGVHVRPRDEEAVPGSPKGSELLYGLALGARLPLGSDRGWAAVVGPELWGASAFSAFTSTNGTAFEGLLTGRVEGTRLGHAQLRVKLGIGAGLHQRFGAPEMRVIVGVEVFGRQAPR